LATRPAATSRFWAYNPVLVETADQFVLALGRTGPKDVSDFRLAHVDHCPHSLIRIPTLRPVVDQFFLRTLHTPTAAQLNADHEPGGRAGTRTGRLPVARSSFNLGEPA
jgi:hypothetical protein